MHCSLCSTASLFRACVDCFSPADVAQHEWLLGLKRYVCTYLTLYAHIVVRHCPLGAPPKAAFLMTHLWDQSFWVTPALGHTPCGKYC